MDIYKQGVIGKVRFQSTKGVLTMEELYTLSQADLAAMLKSAKRKISTSDDELSFLDDTVVQDPRAQLEFEVLKDVYLTKKAAKEEQAAKAQAKANNDKIMAIIAKKQDSALEGLSVDELKKLLA